jgi:uncharacterized protein YbjT (DUF2867 family)
MVEGLTTTGKPTTVAIAGASGFVGSHLCRALRDDYRVVGLARRPREDVGLQWRACDLFSATSTFAALQGADVAVYLVHSMMPSSSLFQGSFHDTDLLLADNFARACASEGVKQIIYLGGLIPEAGFVSAHLTSRHEVECVLQSVGVPVTCLRAGMVVGPEGSSFEILRALVERLPWMILPQWTRSLTQAVYIDDVIAVLKAAILNPAFTGKTLDLVNGETLTYESLLRQTAEAMGKKRLMVRVPIASTGFSKRWVQLFSGAAHELISPLVDSLQCDLPQPLPGPEIAPLIHFPTFRGMLRHTLERPARSLAVSSPPSGGLPTVRSIQRLPSLPQHDAHFISNEYMDWLPRFFHTVVRVTRLEEGQRVVFSLAFLPWPLLVLDYVEGRSDLDRHKFHISGGLLSHSGTSGWLEFRQVADRRFTLSSIHEFVPSLPWPIYVVTQAPIHALVMHHFGRHLARMVAVKEVLHAPVDQNR